MSAHKPHDFSGVEKELSGMSTGYNHVMEMTEASQGLQKSLSAIKNTLKNPNLSESARRALERSYLRGEVTLNKMQETLNPVKSQILTLNFN